MAHGLIRPLASEDDVLDAIGRHFPLRGKGVPVGRGDDCALLPGGRPLAASTDLFLEGVHFRRSYFRPEEVGHKALACNVSDLAACGTRPLAFTLGLALPPDLEPDWFDAFLGGMGALASRLGMALVGGDLSRADRLEISITVFGEETARGAFLSRGGSMPGDALFVVGALGLARAGLQALERMGRAAEAEWPRACGALLRPEPQVDAGLMLARIGMNARPPALMDVSDGLVRDLPRLLGMTGETGVRAAGGGLGAELLLPAGMLHAESLAWCRAEGLNPVREALLGGDDYALLGSCAPDMLPPLHAAIPGFWEIGVVTDGGRIFCNREPLDGLRGFDHFDA